VIEKATRTDTRQLKKYESILSAIQSQKNQIVDLLQSMSHSPSKFEKRLDMLEASISACWTNIQIKNNQDPIRSNQNEPILLLPPAPTSSPQSNPPPTPQLEARSAARQALVPKWNEYVKTNTKNFNLYLSELQQHLGADPEL